MSSSGEQSTGDPKKKVAAFLAGLSSFQLFILTISSGNFSVGRFMLPENLVGIYINRIVITYRITAFIGTLIFQLWVLIGKDKYRTYFPWVSTAFLWLYCLSFSLLLIAYYNGGEKGHIMYYYCGIIFSAFIYGSDNVLLTNMAVGEIVYYIGSLQLISVLISIYQTCFIYCAIMLGFTRIEFKLIVGQLIMAVFLSATSAIAWTVAYAKEGGNNNGEGGSGFSGIWKALSPILMTALGFGMQNFFYPAIAPYKFVGMARGSKIIRTILFTTTIPSISIMLLSNRGVGPNKPWSNTGWHAMWLFYIIELSLGLICISSLHYPSASSFFMMDRMLVVSALTICYDCCVQITRAVGMAGAPAQDGSNQKNPKMDTVNTFAYTTFQLIFVFLGDGYLSTYKRAERDPDNWPTKHYSNLRAFWFWTWSTIKYACKKAQHAYTSDLRGVILGKKDYLFIVYTDG